MSSSEERADERERISNIIAMAIAAGEFRPGQRLVEFQLCQQFQVTRSRIREVLKQLEQHRLVKIIPNVGAVVSELSQKEIEQTFDLIGVLIGLAARVVTPSITPQDIDRLEAIVVRLEGTSDAAEFFEYSTEFHKMIASLSDNEFLLKLVETLTLYLKHCGLAYYAANKKAEAIASHRKILQAIKDRKPVKAEQMAREHLLRAKKMLMKYLNKSL